MTNINWTSISKDILDLTFNYLSSLTQDSADHRVRLFADRISQYLTSAIQNKDQNLIEELEAQLKALGELNNIILNKKKIQELKEFVWLVFKVGLIVASAAV